MKRNQVLHNRYRLRRMSNYKAHKRWRRSKMSMVAKRIIDRVLGKIPNWGAINTVRVFSNAVYVSRRIPERLHKHRYPWRHWAWHCSGRTFGFESVKRWRKR